MNVYNFFVHIHSSLRWLVLGFILLAIINSVLKLSGKPVTNQKDCVANRLALILMHIQLLFGLVLYFISPKVVFAASSMKDSLLRFFLVEHIGMMLIAVILITIGYVKSARAENYKKKHVKLIVYYSLAILIILSAIPWPFRGFGAGWF